MTPEKLQTSYVCGKMHRKRDFDAFSISQENQTRTTLYDPIGADKEGNELSLMDVIPADELVLDEVDRMEKQKLYEKLAYLTQERS